MTHHADYSSHHAPAKRGDCLTGATAVAATMKSTSITFGDIVDLAARALRASKVSESNAECVAVSIACAERDGQPMIGLSYLPTYCDHADCGKVDGNAVPRLDLEGTAVRVDARTGFAHPALAMGLPAVAALARQHGIAALSVGNSYACGSLGYFVEDLASQGLVALMFANASPSMAPWGGRTAFFGTNPIAFAVPRAGEFPLVVDQSSSMVAKMAVIDAHRRGVPLPEGWALDARGEPTRDATAALDGSLLPMGGHKGFGLALMVEILAGALTASNFSFEASSFVDCAGGPPRTGQFVVAIDPARFGVTNLAQRVQDLLDAVTMQPGVRLPGERRIAARRASAGGLSVDTDLLARIAARRASAGGLSVDTDLLARIAARARQDH